MRDMPDPFAMYGKSRAAPQAGGGARFMGLRVIWIERDRAETFALLLGACFCLAILEMKVLRRNHGGYERLATTLAGALRGGALEFEGGPRIEGPLWNSADEPDDEPGGTMALALQTEMNRSRYELLAYDAPQADPREEMVVKVSYLGGGPDPDALVRDEDLLLGVPREFVKPELVGEVEPKSRPPLRALTAGSADGDDPGESVPQPDVS
jgi:hypothetical protein